MEAVLEFLSFSDPGIRVVTAGTMLLGAVASLVGCFTFLQKRALVGDTISHSVLPGICLAFLVSGTKQPYLLLAGAFVSGWLSVLYSDWISRRSKIKADAAIAIVLSFFFAAGMMLLSVIQHGGNAHQAGLHHFLFGKAAAIVAEDVRMFLVVTVIALVVIALYFRPIRIYIFDRDFAGSIGLPLRWLDFLLTTLTVLAIAIGIRAVGVVLMSALLIAPAAIARYWTSDLRRMLLAAVLSGAFAGWAGALISYTAPSMPTGPWVIVVLSLMAFLSIISGREKGVLHDWLKRRRFRRKVLRENILKIFYHLGEGAGAFESERDTAILAQRRPMARALLLSGLRQLERRKEVRRTGRDGWQLTRRGLEESRRLVRLHRLWEVYLSEYMNIAADHVHDDAEAIEHILTPRLQAKLEAVLAGRTIDPHDRQIPE